MIKTVLIAEDNEDLQIIFSRTFKSRGYQVQVVVDGQEALDYLITHVPDILILDVNMPYVSGLDVLVWLRQTPSFKDTKVILVTGNNLAEQSPQAQLADLMLIKPVSTFDLITLADRLTAMAAV
ncbi:MAG: response regulator [Chitinophagaceae bacterium]|nr:response regulator [Anaerolineae bacterium]